MAILSFHRDEVISYKYPNGYWYASAEDLGYDADGLTPLDALMDLANRLEEALKFEENRTLSDKYEMLPEFQETKETPDGDVYE